MAERSILKTWKGSDSWRAYLNDRVGAGSHTSMKSATRAMITFASTKSSSCRKGISLRKAQMHLGETQMLSLDMEGSAKPA